MIIAAGKLPKHNNVSWRGNSCLNDGKDESGTFYKDLVGGYYEARDAIKFNFPQSFAITMLSWSVIEYIKRVLITVEQRSMHDENSGLIPMIKTLEHARIEAHSRIYHN